MHRPSLMSPLRHAALLSTLMTTMLCSLLLAPALLPAMAQAASLQGSGVVATEVRTLPAFQAIALSGNFDLVVRQGDVQSVLVQADDNLLTQLETVVADGKKGPTLQVRWKRSGSGWFGNWQSVETRTKVQVQVTMPTLSALSIAGAGDIRLESFKTPALDLAIAGSGDARLDALETAELGVRVSGSGNVTGRGTATKTSVSIAGSGDVRLMDLRAEEVSVSIAGSGDAQVNAQKLLSVRIAGSGDVVYSGDAEVKTSVAGSGNVKRKRD